MKSLTLLFKALTINKSIPADSALKVAAEVDQEREETQELLKSIKNEVGLYRGEEIEAHLAKMNGTNFNSVAYHYERLPSGQ